MNDDNDTPTEINKVPDTKNDESEDSLHGGEEFKIEIKHDKHIDKVKKYNAMENSPLLIPQDYNLEINEIKIKHYDYIYKELHQYLQYLHLKRNKGEINVDVNKELDEEKYQLIDEKKKEIEETKEEEPKEDEENIEEYSLTSNYIEESLFNRKLLVQTLPFHQIEDFIKLYSKLESNKCFELYISNILSDPENNIKELKNLLQENETSEREDNIFIYLPLDRLENILELSNEMQSDQNFIFHQKLFIVKIIELIEKAVEKNTNLIILVIIGKESNLINHFLIKEYYPISIPEIPPDIIKEILKDEFYLYKKIVGHIDIDYEQLSIQLRKCNILTIKKFVNYIISNYQIKKRISTELIHELTNDFIQEFLINFNKAYKLGINESSNSKIKTTDTSNADHQNEAIQGNNNIFPSSVREFEKQMYLEAASKNYEDLTIALDKLIRNSPLQDNDREILSDYPFILKLSPQSALQKLNDAKIKIEKIMGINTIKND